MEPGACNMDCLQNDTTNDQANSSDSDMNENLMFDSLTIEEYKSMIFLLMEYVGEDHYIDIIKLEKMQLKQKILDICKEHNSMLFELFGILKMDKKLNNAGSCNHVLEKREFNNIDGVWKMFYSICEETKDVYLEGLRQHLPKEINQTIQTAEEWFYWALQKNIISKSDFTSLENIFQGRQNCINIIQNFEKPKCYDISTPTASIDCGIAVIFNFEEFSDNKYRKRCGSDKDVESLKEVWNLFGFKTEVHNNLTAEGTLSCLKYYSDFDHSAFDIFVCCIMSHGQSNYVITSDGNKLPISVIIGRITNSVSLNSKPKLFFIEACQGVNISQEFGKPSFSLDKAQSASVTYLSSPPITRDVLLAVSSINGYVSFMDKNRGSFFMQALCKVMKQKGQKFSFLDIMTEVNNNVRQHLVDFGPDGPRNAQQIVNCQNSFEKTLVFKRRTQ